MTGMGVHMCGLCGKIPNSCHAELFMVFPNCSNIKSTCNIMVLYDPRKIYSPFHSFIFIHLLSLLSLNLNLVHMWFKNKIWILTSLHLWAGQNEACIVSNENSLSFSRDTHKQWCSLAASLPFSSTPLMRPNPGWRQTRVVCVRNISLLFLPQFIIFLSCHLVW